MTRFMMAGTLATALAVLIGCGGSSPTEVEDIDDNPSAVGALNVGVKVTKSRVRSGDTVEISATVNAVRAETVRFSWVNVTGHGQLVGVETGTGSMAFKIQWQAPPSVEDGVVKVEVIQLVVTAIARTISINEKGVQTEHDVATATKTIPIIIAEP